MERSDEGLYTTCRWYTNMAATAKIHSVVVGCCTNQWQLSSWGIRTNNWPVDLCHVLNDRIMSVYGRSLLHCLDEEMEIETLFSIFIPQLKIIDNKCSTTNKQFEKVITPI